MGADPDPNGNAVRDRICMDSKIKLVYVSGVTGQTPGEEIDSRNGVNDAWKKMISSEKMDSEPWIELEEAPKGENLYLKGVVIAL